MRKILEFIKSQIYSKDFNSILKCYSYPFCSLSGSGASLIMPVSVPTSSEPVFPPTTSHRKIARLPSLSIAFSARNGPCELMIVEQPEEQHRARYMTEGSRGAVKDRSGQGHPVVQVSQILINFV